MPIDPNPAYMERIAPNCHRQLPILSALGRGPVGPQGPRGEAGLDSRKDFDTVANMVADDSLEPGDICCTLGFHAVEDDGAAWYKITDDATPNGMDVIALDNGNYALLKITTPYVTPEMFGAYGDGVHDDTQAINTAINKDKVVYFSKNYKISSPVIIRKNSHLIGTNINAGFTQSDSSKDCIQTNRPYREDWSDVFIDGLILQWSNLPDQNTAGIRFQQTGQSDGWGIHNSHIKLRIVNPYYGVYGANSESLWNNDLDFIIANAMYTAFYSKCGGFGNHVKIQHLGNSPDTNIARSLCVHDFTGGEFYLDIEQWTPDPSLSNTCVCFEGSASHIRIPLVHFEQCNVVAQYGSLLTCSFTICDIGLISCYNCDFSTSSQEIVLAYGASTSSEENRCFVNIQNINMLDCTKTGSLLYAIRPTGSYASFINLLDYVGLLIDDAFIPYPSETIKQFCFYKNQPFFN